MGLGKVDNLWTICLIFASSLGGRALTLSELDDLCIVMTVTATSLEPGFAIILENPHVSR